MCWTFSLFYVFSCYSIFRNNIDHLSKIVTKFPLFRALFDDPVIKIFNSSLGSSKFMLMEGNEIANGWPLGLGNMNSRIRVAEASQTAAPPRPSRIIRSSSFSSLSSSSLDTESTASFFPDQSVSLGRLIGIRPRTKGSLYNEHRNISDERSYSGVPKDHENSQGLCAPLLHHVIGKMGKTGISSRH